jgi:hypothetical protein
MLHELALVLILVLKLKKFRKVGEKDMAILNKFTDLGYRLPSISKKFELEMFKFGEEKTIHNDVEAAEREGLKAPIATGPQVAALIFRMMMMCFGEGWIKGGKASIIFRRPTLSNEFATAKGFVKGKYLEGEKIRIVCEVWVETVGGEKTIVGECSGLA